jgi:hypothetical protein
MIILIFIVSEDVMQLIPCLLCIFRAGSNWVSIIVLIEIHQIKTCACCSLVDVFWFPNHENYFGWSWCLSNPLLWQLMVNPWFLTALTGQIDLVLWWVHFIPLVALDVGIMSGIGWLFALWNGNGIVRSSRRSLISQVKRRSSKMVPSKENPFHGSQVISVFIRIDISGLGHLFKTFAQGSHGSHSSHQLVMKGGHCTIRKLKEMEKISPVCCTVGNFWLNQQGARMLDLHYISWDIGEWSSG